MGLINVQVETNSKRVADALKETEIGQTSFSDYISAGKRCMKDQPSYSVTWVCRNANNLTRIFARTARNFESPHCWVEPLDHVDDQLDRCSSCIWM